jgi:hypothetical protein
MLNRYMRAIQGYANNAREAIKDQREAIIEYMVKWGYFWFLIRTASVYWIARYACAFSVAQSIFLTALYANAIEARHLRRAAARQFQPFSFSISPAYRTILTDAGLLAHEPDANAREWAALIEVQAEGEIPWSGSGSKTKTFLRNS